MLHAERRKVYDWTKAALTLQLIIRATINFSTFACTIYVPIFISVSLTMTQIVMYLLHGIHLDVCT